MATPHVTGAAALLKSLLPGLDGEAVGDILKATALDLGSSGFDTSYGHGFILRILLLIVINRAPLWCLTLSIDIESGLALRDNL